MLSISLEAWAKSLRFNYVLLWTNQFVHAGIWDTLAWVNNQLLPAELRWDQSSKPRDWEGAGGPIAGRRRNRCWMAATNQCPCKSRRPNCSLSTAPLYRINLLSFKLPSLSSRVFVIFLPPSHLSIRLLFFLSIGLARIVKHLLPYPFLIYKALRELLEEFKV